MLGSRSQSLIEDDPDVGGHRDDHLAVVLGLFLLLGGEVHLGELGDAVDEHRDLFAELLLEFQLSGVPVSSTTSCSSAAAMVTESSWRSAALSAVPTGWWM